MSFSVRYIVLALFGCMTSPVFLPAQQVSRVYKNFIATPQLYGRGDQLRMPVYTLGSNEQMQLEFDDLEGGVKSYYYTFVLCDYNWNPVNLSPFDFLKGFTQMRIATYRYSSIALTRYTHYMAQLPDRDCMPVKSGNYLVKVYLDGDTSKLCFTRQMLVLDPKSVISAEVVQPFTPEKFRTHQKVRFTATIKNINAFSAAQQVKAVVLQNYRWDIAQRDIPPTFIRGNTLEYNSENYCIFPGGKEWRWADLRGFRLQSDRVDSAVYRNTSTEIFMKLDRDRSENNYIYFSDLDGMFYITTYESINPSWQGDYANVHFYFSPPGGREMKGRDMYIQGGFTGFVPDDKWKMRFNDSMRVYEAEAFLKQGYYNYAYASMPAGAPNGKREDYEGNYWETENIYTILLYYKGFTDRCDQLIGVSTINTLRNRPGFSF